MENRYCVYIKYSFLSLYQNKHGKIRKSHIPVFIRSECFSNQDGKLNPKNREIPNTTRFLEELRSTYCKLDAPTAAKTPAKVDDMNQIFWASL